MFIHYLDVQGAAGVLQETVHGALRVSNEQNSSHAPARPRPLILMMKWKFGNFHLTNSQVNW